MRIARFPSAVVVTLALLGAATAASAQDKKEMAQQMQARFTKADADHDGKLTKAEAEAGMPRVAAKFDEIDSEHTGSITLEQILKFAAAQKK